jgi:hypothetical protein
MPGLVELRDEKAPLPESRPVSTLVDDLRPLARSRPLQLGVLTVLLAAVGAIAFQLKYCVLDYDIWWHLKVGDWIVEHLSVPHTGILSRTAAGRPWVAYSWGYEVLLSRAYAWFGLVGIGVFGTLLTVAVAYAVYGMARRLSGRIWMALVLTAIACAAFLFNGMPRPFFFSIVLFCVTLTLLLEANQSGCVERLYWLPFIFVIWGNLHIQFVYGLLAVGLFVGVNLAQRCADRLGIAPGFLAAPILPVGKLVVLLAACTIATLIGPNFYHPYQAVYAYGKSKFSYSIIIELQALSFRGISHYLELMLTAAAFFAVGWQKKLDPFKLVLLAVASIIAYRTMRDAWFICIPAVACIASLPLAESQPDRSETWWEKTVVAAAVASVLLVFSTGTDFTPRGLDRAISAEYPVNAVNFLRRNPVPGPLYNNLNWGGFLMWYMPEYPVAIDGRNDLYGDQLDQVFFNSEIAGKSYATDPYLNEAGVVLLDSQLPLAKVLTVDPRFQLVYRDAIATVFARR